ncbi:MAG TPA: orotate phosphoribosyltransferase [Bacteroidales bacterium]|nr:orotate phosphoribosyltransferase [Bacteroidales bacterium]
MKTNRRVAELLLQSKAIKLEPASPFTWASGWKSPIYCDNRKTLSFPEIRSFIRDVYVETIRENFEIPDIIAGVATGAIAQGALVAEALNLPFIYIRSQSKSHGMRNMIEGYYEKGQSVVVIEDLISTGGSSLKAVEALREAECNVTGMVATFTYQFKTAIENFKNAHLEVLTLTDYDTMLSLAVEQDYITEKALPLLQQWRLDPGNWTGK